VTPDQRLVLARFYVAAARVVDADLSLDRGWTGLSARQLRARAARVAEPAVEYQRLVAGLDGPDGHELPDARCNDTASTIRKDKE